MTPWALFGRSRRSAGIAVLVASFATAAGTPALAEPGPAIDYTLQCRGCHGPDGRGARDAVPSLRGELGKFLWVPGGRQFLLQVPGSAQSELSDARLAALLNWMLRRFSPELIPPDFTPFSEEEVARHRTPLTDVEGVRKELVRAIEGVPALAARTQTPTPPPAAADRERGARP